MTKYQSLVIIALSAVASLLIIGEASAKLSDRLLASNFNLYSSPSPAGNMVLQDLKDLKDLKGKPVSLSGLKGKVIILNFWKIDCPPCSLEKPILEKIHKKFADRGLKIIAVNLFDGPDKLRSYVQRSGLSFTFAFDGAKRLSVRQQKVGAGPSTTFVVNSRSEAIYEIPGVPTTYVIDRNGRVVGSSVGLINWEEEPFQELLESLLGTQQDTVAHHQEFTEPAREGARAQFVSTTETGPEMSSRLAQQVPDNQDAPPALPFQGPSRGPVAAPSTQLHEPAPVEQPSVVEPAPPAPAKTAKPAPKPQPKKKPVQQATKPDSVKPKPIKHTTSPAARTVHPAAGVSPAPPGLPAARPVTQAPVAPGAGAQSELPPLPPAIPYTPNSTGTQQGRPLVPDENGAVTARIPDPNRSQTYYPGQGSATSLPPAQPVSGANPIDGFILDSFKSSAGQSQRPVPVQPPQQPSADKPATSVIDQVGRDMRQLGSGIRDTFSRIIPGGR
jgi:thiol-disulfide isomerase/thioredoxin